MSDDIKEPKPVSPHIKPKDLKQIEQDELHDPIVRFLKHQDSTRFNIGDILVKQYRSKGSHGENGGWTTKTVSNVSHAPSKYIYVHENDNGVGYLKQIKADGKISELLICMTSLNPNSERYCVDPDYQDHLILGQEGEFDVTKLYNEDKKHREQIHKKNKALVVNASTDAKANEILSQLKVGDRFWMAYDIYSATTREWEVTGTKAPRAAKQAAKHWGRPETDGTTNLVVEIEVKDTKYAPGASRTLDTSDVRGQCVFLTKPFSYDNNI